MSGARKTTGQSPSRLRRLRGAARTWSCFIGEHSVHTVGELPGLLLERCVPAEDLREQQLLELEPCAGVLRGRVRLGGLRGVDEDVQGELGDRVDVGV